MLEISCAWSKGSGERLQGHHGLLVLNMVGNILKTLWERFFKHCVKSRQYSEHILKQNNLHLLATM